MKSIRLNRVSRILAAFIATLMLLLSCVGCASRALPTNDEDLTVVGTVGEYEVLYEEFRFLVLTYKKQLEDLHGKEIWQGEKADEYRSELKRLVYEDVEANYAVLTLAEKEGIATDSYKSDVQEYMDTMLREDFGNDRASYKDFLQAMNLTDHYVRFTAAVDAAYEDLYFAYLGSDRIPDAEDTVKQYILQNFVYVVSISITNKTEDEYEKNEEKAKNAREEVVDGADIFDYVNLSLDLTPEHCFTRGEMDKDFEEKAFALQPGEVSEVFLGTADYLGDTRSAWYFLKRLDLTAAYVEENYTELFDQYANARMNDYLNETKETLVFVPNDYCKSLDLLAIEPIDEVKDNTWVFVTVGIVGGVVLIVGAVVLFKILNRKPAPAKKRGGR